MEMLGSLLPWAQIIISVLLITAILLQKTGASVGGSFGGGADAGTHATRRGAEKTLFNATIVLAALFAVSAFVALLL